MDWADLGAVFWNVNGYLVGWGVHSNSMLKIPVSRSCLAPFVGMWANIPHKPNFKILNNIPVDHE